MSLHKNRRGYWPAGALLLALSLCAALYAETGAVSDRPPGLGAPERPAKSRTLEPDVELAPKELGLTVGEQLIYDIKVEGVPSGKVLLEVKREDDYEGKRVWLARIEIRSNRAVSLYYDVASQGRSFIDTKGGFTRNYYMDRHEGEVNYEERISFKYDIGNMEATYERPAHPEKEAKYKDLRKYPPILLSTKVLDPLAALYYIRKIDFESILQQSEDKRFFVLPICTDRRVWNTKVMVCGHSYEDFAGLTHRECISLVPLAEFKGLFERKSTMALLVDVKTGIPVKMKVEVPIGTAEVELSSYSRCPLPEPVK